MRVFLGVVALSAVGFAVFRTWDDVRAQILPDAWTLVIAAALVVGSLIGGGMSWYTLFKGHTNASRRLISDFYLAQLGKYLPGGGIWQAAGQVGLSTSPELSAVRLSTNLAVHGVIQLAAALTLGGFLLFASGLPTWLRVVCGFGLLAPLVLHRSWMAYLLGRVGGWLRLDTEHTVPPGQSTILRSWFWSLLPITGFSVAYAIMVGSLQPDLALWQTSSAFAMAWAIGFAVIPFPAGLGVREAALVLLVGGSTAAIVAASLALRLIAIGGDVVLVTITRRIRA